MHVLKGLAYVDFLDEAHLAAAVAKNKKMLLGKHVSVARSNPKQKKKGILRAFLFTTLSLSFL